jgi:hypothetical protein
MCDENRRVRAKSVIHDEAMFSQMTVDSDDEKEEDEFALRGTWADAACSFVHNAEKGEKTPEKKRSRPAKDDSNLDDSLNEKTVSPFDDTDDSDFSLTETVAPRKKLKKKKRRRKRSKKDNLSADKDVSELLTTDGGPRKKSKTQKSSESTKFPLLALTNGVSSREEALGAHATGDALVIDPNSKKRGRKRLTASKSTGRIPEKSVPLVDQPAVGDRVYAEWSDRHWYWAIITHIKRKKSKPAQYTVRTSPSLRFLPCTKFEQAHLVFFRCCMTTAILWTICPAKASSL